MLNVRRVPSVVGHQRLLRRPLSTAVPKKTTDLQRNAASLSSTGVKAAEMGRPLSALPTGKLGLYDPSTERDSCGVGLVAQLKSVPSRDIVDDANEMLVRMSHRGGCGCDPFDGDGAGMLVGMPHAFIRKVAREDCGGLELPADGQFGVGNIFIGAQGHPELQAQARELVDRSAKDHGLKVLGWRTVPVNNTDLGAAALGSEPITDMCFIAAAKEGKFADTRTFERELYRLQKVATTEAEEAGGDLAGKFYINSMSSQTITYKGQLTPAQVVPYFGDLSDPDFTTHMALVHSRFSTNTFPSWDRAQPIRMMCHNGEINTLRGNKNWMQSRGGLLESTYFADDTQSLLPATSDNMSDSGNFDAVLELNVKAGDKSLPETMMMMIPEAWQDNDSLSPAKKAFYQYNSCVMEPWDGPAMVAFTDGRYIGATLDRNGLRPSRYYVTHDDRVLLSSEIGVLPELPDAMVKDKQRLEPGKMFLVDFERQKIVPDAEIKEAIASKRPYGQWLEEGLFQLDDWASHAKTKGVTAPSFNFSDSTRRFNLFGYTTETMDMLLYPMAVGGKEALGSMGNDAALAVLSDMPRNVFDYFKQLFAQVTNPPIDPIREEMVMSLVCPVGPEANLLATPGPEHCARLVVEHPILSLEEMEALKSTEFRGWRTAVIDSTFEAGSGAEGLQEALGRICEEASEHIQGDYGDQGVQGLILSDRLAGPGRLPIPSLLAVGAVHQHLLQTQQRPKGALFCEAGDAREVHDFATLLGYGADGVCPYVAYEALAKMNAEGQILARAKQEYTEDELFKAYRNSAAKGLLKVMSKMGISTLQSYKGAQVFEVLGLAEDVVDRCFTGTQSRIQGADFEALTTDLERFHSAAYEQIGSVSGTPPLVPNPGNFNYRNGGEQHLNTPSNMVALQDAARNNSRDAYGTYSKLVDEQTARVTLRGLLKFDLEDPSHPAVPLDQVEPVEAIVKRFVTGAMSLGSISQETHETLAVAMNRLKARSNTGEGGEDPVRFLDDRRSAIKQVASGRFGVTSHYLANSDQIQIKMAQGAKPGEGGELPGFKVTPYIGECRGTTPGVGLISPPPHHDIYSIEDLAQLIHDLKNAQPLGDVSVKLVSEVGVGVVAAGVAKAKADHVTVSGGDGGTGAAAWTGVKGAGLPWELGLAEAHQTLVLNGLRSRIRLQTDGQLKNGRDVVVAALLGAEEFGFSTAPLIALGCIMMRKCHLNTCPVGIATQDPELRKKFSGEPEHVMNFFWLLAEEVREHMASLGYKNMDEMVGQTQRLAVDTSRMNYKSKGLDLSPLLLKAADLNPDAGLIHSEVQDHEIGATIDRDLITEAMPALEHGTAVVLETKLATNLQRTLGTMLSYEVSKRYGKEGLPDKTVHVKLSGHGGQSLGFCLAKGIFLDLEGDSNDGVGKSLSGGVIAVYPAVKGVLDSGFVAGDNVVVGNVCLYGASSGAAYFSGNAGERFAVRNSGALAVVEGVGDHGCEYMTGGRVVILGETGRNFAAGMSGGVAYVYDPEGAFPDRCNMGMVALEKVGPGPRIAALPLGDGNSAVDFDAEDEGEVLKAYIEAHVAHTGSQVGKDLLDKWSEETVQHFVKVMPTDFKRVLEEDEAKAAAGNLVA